MKAAALNPAGMVPAAPIATIPYILDRLSEPKVQGPHVNPPPTGKRRARGEGASESKSVRPSQRVSEFPKEYIPHGLS